MKKKPFESVNIWKGITILSVLNIHACFWSGKLYLPDWTRNWSLLLDVPVFFFISGFLMQSDKAVAILLRGLRQIIRLAVDYGIISILAIALAVAGKVAFSSKPDLDVLIAIDSAVKFLPEGSLWSEFRVYGGSLWYLHVFIPVVPLGVLIISSPLKRGLICLPFISYLIYILTTVHPELIRRVHLVNTRDVAFYLSLFLAGAAFRKHRERFSLFAMSLAWAFLLAMTFGICIQKGELHHMQRLKFPPSPLYLLFSLHSVMAVCMLVLLEARKPFTQPVNRFRSFISWCGQHTFRLYLWQGVAASVPYLFVPFMLKIEMSIATIFLEVLAWNLAATLGLTYGYNRLVSAVVGFFKHSSSPESVGQNSKSAA